MRPVLHHLCLRTIRDNRRMRLHGHEPYRLRQIAAGAPNWINPLASSRRFNPSTTANGRTAGTLPLVISRVIPTVGANRMPTLRRCVDCDEQVAGKQWRCHFIDAPRVPALFEVARQINLKSLPAKMQSRFGLGMDVGLGDVPEPGWRHLLAAGAVLTSLLQLIGIRHQRLAGNAVIGMHWISHRRAVTYSTYQRWLFVLRSNALALLGDTSGMFKPIGGDSTSRRCPCALPARLVAILDCRFPG